MSTIRSSRTVQLAVAGALALCPPVAASAQAAENLTYRQYIVSFAPLTPTTEITAARAMADAGGGRILYQYTRALKGFAARLSADAVTALRHNPEVLAVEPDRAMHAADIAPATQFPATWGLDRIDQAYLPLDYGYTYGATGTGVTAYVVDTGIRATHTEFGGRVAAGFTAIEDGHGTDDCNGHGTHVAGTIGGSTYGVAKSVTLVPVRVLGCDGSGMMSGVLAGIEWVTAHHSASSVANMSLGGPPTDSVDAAVGNSIAAGVNYAVAAGNESTTACTTSPARLPAAITVGASNAWDQRASFSNYGACVDLFAPGQDITSATSDSDTATAVYSGTSMATPHVAGVIALYLQAMPGAGPSDVRDAVLGNATRNVLTETGPESPNSLLRAPAAPGRLCDSVILPTHRTRPAC